MPSRHTTIVLSSLLICIIVFCLAGHVHAAKTASSKSLGKLKESVRKNAMATTRTNKQVKSVDGLYANMFKNDHDVKLKAGTYKFDADEYWRLVKLGHKLYDGSANIEYSEKNGLFQFAGKKSKFDLTGVTFEFDMTSFNGKKMGKLILVSGQQNTVIGLTITKKGTVTDLRKHGGTMVRMHGKDHLVKNFDISTFSSTPYGFGHLWGLNQHTMANVNLLTKAGGVEISSCWRCTLDSVRIDMNGLGHIIWINGHSKDIMIQNSELVGGVRTTDDLLDNQLAGTDRNGNPWNLIYGPKKQYYNGAGSQDKFAKAFTTKDLNRKCTKFNERGCKPKGPWERGGVYPLVECGIRSYSGIKPGAKYMCGKISVKNTVVRGTRCGFCGQMPMKHTAPASVDGLTARGNPGGGFEPWDRSTLTNCKGDSQYAGILNLNRGCGGAHSVPQINYVKADIEILDLEQGQSYNLNWVNGNNRALAHINGKGHQVVMWRQNPKSKLINKGGNLRIRIAPTRPDGGICYKKSETRDVKFCSLNGHDVEIGSAATHVTVYAYGRVTNKGQHNTIVNLNKIAYNKQALKYAGVPEWCYKHFKGPSGIPKVESKEPFLNFNMKVAITGGDAVTGTNKCGPDRRWFGCRAGLVTSQHPRRLIFNWGPTKEKDIKYFYIRRPDPARSRADGCVKYGNKVVVAYSAETYKTGNCGWYGCRTLRVEPDGLGLFFGHAGPKAALHTFVMRPPAGDHARLDGECISFGTPVMLARSTEVKNGCGDYGCRVAQVDVDRRGVVVVDKPVHLTHGSKAPLFLTFNPPVGYNPNPPPQRESRSLRVAQPNVMYHSRIVLQTADNQEVYGENKAPGKVEVRGKGAGTRFYVRRSHPDASRANGCVKYNDQIILAITKEGYKTGNCGWYGTCVVCVCLPKFSCGSTRRFSKLTAGLSVARSSSSRRPTTTHAPPRPPIQPAAPLTHFLGCRRLEINDKVVQIAKTDIKASRLWVRAPLGQKRSGCVKVGDAVVLSSSAKTYNSGNCGWYGCRKLQFDKHAVEMGHKGKAASVTFKFGVA